MRAGVGSVIARRLGLGLCDRHRRRGPAECSNERVNPKALPSRRLLFHCDSAGAALLCMQVGPLPSHARAPCVFSEGLHSVSDSRIGAKPSACKRTGNGVAYAQERVGLCEGSERGSVCVGDVCSLVIG
eukprot:scaffold93631_cov72-Phaeocystis_antarctica.AAC.2